MTFEKEKVKISIEPFYLVSDSDPTNNLYSFEYNVKIENFSNEEIQLLERYLLLKSGEAVLSETIGMGVDGKLPVLKKGDSFEYISEAKIKDPFGSLKSIYTFRSKGGEYFLIEIPHFPLYAKEMVVN